MIPAAFDYDAPTTLTDALQLLDRHGPDARPLAGGHTLLPVMKLGRQTPARLVDLGRIPELRGISVGGDTVRVGATTTHAEIEHDPDLRTACPLLPDAARHVADPLIRNRGTLGGSLAAADPQGDWPVVVLALGATLHLQSARGHRAVPADAFFLGAHRTALRHDEVLHTIELPVTPPGALSAYVRRTHPASGYAMVSAAVSITTTADGVVDRARVVVGGLTPTPTRLSQVEGRLVGQRFEPDRIAEAVDEARRNAVGLEVTGDAFGSGAYRRSLVPVYVRRAMVAARP